MNRFFGASCIAIVVASTPAYAGEEVLYAAAPGWVQIAEVDRDSIDSGPSEILADWQHRLDGGVVSEYNDRAVRIDNLEALTSEGTLQMIWSPDKGDLTIHAFEIWRGDEVIDLVADGVRFETLRRERQLEQRLLDGRLTATVAVPGLREGDVLRVAHSITVDDQALGDEMQALQYLPPEPYRVGFGRTIMSWPVDADIAYRAEPGIDLGRPTERDGFNYLTVDLPIAKRDEMPTDAPSRFSRAPILRAGSFDSWQQLSRVMQPHYGKAAIVEDGSDVAAQADRIMNRTADPLERMGLAVRLVQDQVSYLMNGLDGGNYLPQAAEDTWDKRYGDCKAKSVLLHALLQRMDISSDVVLVSTRGGDAIPELLPMPANFDHMIVRATVGGTDYWLDGTSTATRLANIANVPPFHYALPLTEAGADLTPMSDRAPAYPDMTIAITFDHSAGVDLPTTYELRMELSGPAGAALQSIVDEDDPEMKKQLTRQFSSGTAGQNQVTSIDVTYDEEAAIGTMLVNGVGEPMFEFDAGQMELPLTGGAASAQFAPNRARPKWRRIPVQNYGPQSNRSITTFVLPEGGEGYLLDGNVDLDRTYAGNRIVRNASIDSGQLVVEEQQISSLGEIAVADLAQARRDALAISKSDLSLRAPADSTWRWELSPSVLAKRTSAARKGYDLAVAQADDDDFAPLLARAGFFQLIYDYEKAVGDLDRVIAEEPSEALYFDRASSYESLNMLDQAIDDLQSAYDLNPDNDTAYYQAHLMARAGRPQDALELLDLLPVSDDEMDAMIEVKSSVLALAGRVDEGLALLADRLSERTDSSPLLNADCWYRGLNAIALDDAIALCTRALERTGSTANVLDSRAMVHFRKGDYVSALNDLDAALKLNPGLAASRYLRGIVLLEQGKKEGADQVASALRQLPELGPHYALYGIAPAT